MYSIGIDLGTTFSVAAVINSEGIPEVLPNRDGERGTPSIVYFGELPTIIVGSEAAKYSLSSPDSVVTRVKNFMGHPWSEAFGDQKFSAEEVSALILRSVAEDVSAELGAPIADLNIVITVPAYFGTAEREATANAAKIAGLSCLQLVAEPVAAAVAYGLGSNLQGQAVVCDLGGGTFDVTVVSFFNGQAEVVSVDGVSELGGVNFDDELVTLALDKLVAATGDDDVFDDDEVLNHLNSVAQNHKKALSKRMSTTISVPYEGQKYSVEITRHEFEQSIQHLVTICLEAIDRAVAASNVTPTHLLLVGGSTRIPCVKEAFHKHLGIQPTVADPDFAVAKGAAIYADSLAQSQHSRQVGHMNVSNKAKVSPMRAARAIGVLLADSFVESPDAYVVKHIIKQNTQLPVVNMKYTVATTCENQETMRFQIMEQKGRIPSDDPAANRLILDAVASGLSPNLPAGSPVDLYLGLSADGLISIKVRDRKRAKNLDVSGYMDGITSPSKVVEAAETIRKLVIDS